MRGSQKWEAINSKWPWPRLLPLYLDLSRSTYRSRGRNHTWFNNSPYSLPKIGLFAVHLTVMCYLYFCVLYMMSWFKIVIGFNALCVAGICINSFLIFSLFHLLNWNGVAHFQSVILSIGLHFLSTATDQILLQTSPDYPVNLQAWGCPVKAVTTCPHSVKPQHMMQRTDITSRGILDLRPSQHGQDGLLQDPERAGQGRLGWWKVDVNVSCHGVCVLVLRSGLWRQVEDLNIRKEFFVAHSTICVIR